MKREQQTNRADDVLADVGDSLREWSPSLDEERGTLDRVWTGLRWKADQVPADVVRSVELDPRPARWNRRSTVWAVAAAALVIAAVGGAIVWPRGARAYAAGADGLQVTLADDSRVEMRAHSELTVDQAADGIHIDLKKGGIIVNAAEQRDGHLYVRTKDMTVAVVGTVFFVSAGDDGSRVAVIEGEVRVQNGTIETTLRPGEQMSSRPIPAAQVRPVIEEIAWSRRKDAYLALLQSAVAAAPSNQQASSTPPAPGQGAAASGQPAGAEFEEASIRVCDPNNLPPGGRGGGMNMFRMTPGRTYGTCLTLATLIRTAYGYGLLEGPVTHNRGPRGPGGNPRDIGAFDTVLRLGLGYFLGSEDGSRVRGGPDWVRSELYTIEAVAAASADAQTMRGPMLRALLERRFGLRVHVETEQIPALTLTVAPGGLKMKEGTCTKSETPSGGGRAAQLAQSLAAVRRNLDAARRGATTTGRCGMAVALNGPNLLMVGAGVGVPPPDDLAEMLDAPILDQTGIPDAATFNYVLEFVPDDSLRRELRDQLAAAGSELQIASDPLSVPRAPGIFTALEEQLGLRLERARAPREFIVIDAVEKPAPN